jgi:hypothetical protein
MCGKTLLIGSVVVLGLGCGGRATVVNPTGKGGMVRVIDRAKISSNLRQIGIAYQNFPSDAGPKGADDLLPFLENNPTFAKLLKGDDVVVYWGVRLQSVQSPGQTILAYERDADENGSRYVLMADATVKTMTDLEFKAAPKAGK